MIQLVGETTLVFNIRNFIWEFGIQVKAKGQKQKESRYPKDDNHNTKDTTTRSKSENIKGQRLG